MLEKRIPFEQDFYPPLPTKTTLFFRTNIIWQLIRFIIINVKVLRLVKKH